MVSIDTGKATLVLVDRIKREDIYGELEGKRLENRREEVAQMVVRKLAPHIPEYLDGVVATETTPNVYSTFGYAYFGERGRTEVRATFRDDLSSVINNSLLVDHDSSNREEVRERVKGKSGMVIEHPRYSLGRDRSHKEEDALRLHRQVEGGFLYVSAQDITKPFEAYLNALFRGEMLDEAWVREPRQSIGPMKYADGTCTTDGIITDPTILRMQRAEETIGPFFQWLKENRETIDAVGDLVRYAYEQFKRAEYQKGRATKRNRLPLIVAEQAEACAMSYIAQARKLEIRPIATDRMLYFK